METPKQDPLYVLRDLEQVKVIADPLRVKILDCFASEPRTTKQVAELIGEKPTRLYHHVDALERVGLIRLTQTRQNRGTVEKYYLAVARMFQVEPGLFSAAEAPGEASSFADLVTTMMDNTTSELRQVIDSGVDLTSTEEGILSFAEVRVPAEQIVELRNKLMALLEELTETAAERPESDSDRRYRLTLALFPLDAEKRKP
jgi:DNA-binding transcriptional ArsR family regulator